MSIVLFVSAAGDVPEILTLLNHKTTLASDAAQALRELESCDVVIVDGREDLAWSRTVTTTIHNAGGRIPILLMIPATGMSLISAQWGFDDFVNVQAEATELDARIRLLLRSADESTVLTMGPIRLDEAAYSVAIGQEPLDLTYTEFELLRFLMQHPGRVLTREVLLSQVWGYDYYGGTRTVDVHIRRLRAKLGQYETYIGTVRNVGYRFTSVRDIKDD